MWHLNLRSCGRLTLPDGFLADRVERFQGVPLTCAPGTGDVMSAHFVLSLPARCRPGIRRVGNVETAAPLWRA